MGSVDVEVPTVMVSDVVGAAVVEVVAASIVSDVDEGTFVEERDVSAMVVVGVSWADDNEETKMEEDAEEVEDEVSCDEGACLDVDVDAT